MEKIVLVLNATARLYHLKAKSSESHRVVIHLSPGLNELKQRHWEVVKKSEFVETLIKEGKVKVGKEVDEMEYQEGVMVSIATSNEKPVKPNITKEGTKRRKKEVA